MIVRPGLQFTLGLLTLIVGFEARSDSFIRRHPTSLSSEYLDAALDLNGNIVVCGSATNSSPDFLVSKYSGGGQLLWSRTIDGPFAGEDRADAVTVDGNNNVIVTGTSQGADGRANLLLVKFDADGNELWQFRSTPLTYLATLTTANVFLDPQGNIIATASAHIAQQDPTQTAFFYKRDPAGNEIWTRQHFSSGVVHSVSDQNGGLYAVFDYMTGLGANDTAIVATRYDGNGTHQWDKQYGFNTQNFDEVADIAVSSTGDLYICGFSGLTPNIPDYAYLTYSYDLAGDLRWQRIGSPGVAVGVAIDATNNVYIGCLSYVHGGSDVIKYDSSGMTVWTRSTQHYFGAGPILAYGGVGAGERIVFAGGFSSHEYDPAGTLLSTRKFAQDCPEQSLTRQCMRVNDRTIMVGTYLGSGPSGFDGMLAAYDDGATCQLFVKEGALGADNGESWQDAFKSLQFALGFARCGCEAGAELWVAAGTYRPTSSACNPNRSASFEIDGAIGLYGGFEGIESQLSQRDPVANTTRLTGDITGNDVAPFGNNVENSHHVVDASSAGTDAILDGFMIVGGNANGTTPDNDGGGIYMASGSARIRNCRIVGNAAVRAGGATFVSGPGATPNFENCIFSGNYSGTYGGAIHCEESAEVLALSCTFNHNTSISHGGAIYVANNGTVNLRSSILWSDQAPQGDEIRLISGNANVAFTLIDGGSSAILNSGGILTLGSGNIDGNPGFFDALGMDGVPGSIDDDLHISHASVCFDAGDPTFTPGAGVIDIDGQPRLAGCRVDMGADEVLTGLPNSGDLDGDGQVTQLDVNIFVSVLLQGNYNCVADVDVDGRTDGIDVKGIVEILLQ